MSRTENGGMRKARRPGRGAVVSYGPDLFPWVLAFIALAAFAVRLAFLFELKSTPFFPAEFSDSRIYLESARSIIRGETAAAAYFMSPLYPYFLAAIEAATGDVGFWARFLQCLAGAVAVLMVGLLGKRMWTPGAGALAALLAALSPQLIFMDNMILIESLLTLAVIAHLFFLHRLWKEGRLLDGALSGLFLGVALVFRFSLIAAPVAYVLFFAFGRREIRPALKPFAIMLIAAAAFVAPFTIRNAVVEGVFAPVTNSGGFNYYAGNNGGSEGWHRVPEPVDIGRDPNGAAYASRALGRELTSSQVSAFWFGKSWKWASANPGEWGLLQLRKLLLFFHAGDIDQTGLSMRFFRMQYRGVLSVPFPTIWPLLLVLAMLGMASALEEKKLKGPVFLFAAAFVASTAVFFVNSRLRIPLLPVFALYAGYGMVSVWMAVVRRSMRRKLTYAVYAVGLFGLITALQPGIPETYESEYRMLGDAAFRGGDFAEAERLFTRSLAEARTPEGWLNRGNALAARGKHEDAAASYDSAVAMRPDFALVWFNRGNLSLQKNDADGAMENWRRAAELDPDLAAAHRNMGLLLARAGRLQEASARLQKALSLEKDPAVREIIRADLEMIRGGPM